MAGGYSKRLGAEGMHFYHIIRIFVIMIGVVGGVNSVHTKTPSFLTGFVFLLRRVQDLNLRRIVIPCRISNTQSHDENYRMCAINVLCFLDY